MSIETPALPAHLAAIADALERATASATPIPPPSASASELTAADAYAIAQYNVARHVVDGAQVVGHKVGLTATAIQEQLGVDQPDYGALLDSMEIPDGGSIEIDRLIAPRVELELAFHLSDRLAGPGVTVEEVRAATADVQPSIELVDSRIAEWRITLVDTVADAASSARFVLGGRRVALDRIDVADLDLELERNGEIVERGNSSAVLGNPCESVAWLANALSELGVVLEPGHIVLSGTCTRVVAAHAGDRFVGHFGELGTVSLNFTGREP
jgi:2-keto-4-pentenoate hydratase